MRSNTRQLAHSHGCRVPLLACPAVRWIIRRPGGGFPPAQLSPPGGGRGGTGSTSYRGGLTLVELLIVMAILTALVAAAIPILSPSTNNRRIREASRAVNTFITGAQSRAMALRRPYGVMLKKLSKDTGNAVDNGICIEMFYVEQPPAYTGFDESSAVRLALDRSQTAYANQVIIQFVRREPVEAVAVSGSSWVLPPGWDKDLIPSGMFRQGDYIDVAGTLYQIIDTTSDLDENLYYDQTSGEPDGVLVARPVTNSSRMLEFKYDSYGYEIGNGDGQRKLTAVDSSQPVWTEPSSYRILRSFAQTSAEPYQLPEGVAIDLRASGLTVNYQEADPKGFFHRPEINVTPPYGTAAEAQEGAVDNREPIVILFSPEGSVQNLYYNVANTNLPTPEPNVVPDPVISNIYLMIGLVDNMVALPDMADDITLDPSQIRASNTALTNEDRDEIRGSINWLAEDSRWVVIGSQSGRIVSTENSYAPIESWSDDTSTPHPYITANGLQRRAWQIRGAREYAREMTQSGGD